MRIKMMTETMYRILITVYIFQNHLMRRDAMIISLKGLLKKEITEKGIKHPTILCFQQYRCVSTCIRYITIQHSTLFV
jgi:hypothetical protein